MSPLQWKRNGDFLDAGGYRVVRNKVIREDRPAYFAYTAFAGRDRLGCEDSNKEARVLCEEHYAERGACLSD